MKFGRNSLCWCGSGKKFKKCHLQTVGGGNDLQKNAVFPDKSLILNEVEIEKMRRACKFNVKLMDHIRPFVREGIRTDSIDEEISKYTLDHGFIPACFNYKGFKKKSCISPNDIVCHGVPSEYIIKDGDIVNVDLTTIVDGFHGDHSEMFLIGNVSEEGKKLCEAAFIALEKGIAVIKPNYPVGIVGSTIQEYIESLGYSIVRDFQGHGIGRKFHQNPSVPHFTDKNALRSLVLPGMCFTVEPMVNLGGYETYVEKKDGWTVRTIDGSLSAQWEHTILVTNDGAEILTKS